MGGTSDGHCLSLRVGASIPPVKKGSLASLVSWCRNSRVAPFVVVLGWTSFVYWRALFAGGSLIPADILTSGYPPFDWATPFGQGAERASGDLVNIHSHWAMFGERVRGAWSWWDSSLGLGYPTMKGGFPIFTAPYAVLPAWFAPGVYAAFRTATAWLLMFGWLRSYELRRSAALLGGAAFALSGFVVGWGGWPHAAVAALAPGLLWAVDRVLDEPCQRRAVPVGVVGALMVWSNFPIVTVYVITGTLLLVGFRLWFERRDQPLTMSTARRLLGSGAIAGVVALGLALPHILHFRERLAWADTSARQFAVDSSAGGEHLLTMLLPAAFGTDGHGPAWWSSGNFVEYQIHVGGPVLLLGMAAWAATGTSSACKRRRRGAVAGLWAMSAFGMLVGYIGGWPTDTVQSMLGELAGLATRSKVLISLGFAGLAGFGLDAWLDSGVDAARRQRRATATALGVFLLLALHLAPAMIDWAGDLEALGHRRTTLVASMIPLGATAVVALALFLRARRPHPAAWFLPVMIAASLLEITAFAMPIPTVADRNQRLEATPEHELVAEILEPGERLAGEGWLFFPSSTQALGLDALGGDILRSPGHTALLRAVDPAILAGGIPTYPILPIGADPTLSVWDALGVGVWAISPDQPVPGVRTEPPFSLQQVDALRDQPVGRIQVPEGGLRAILLKVDIDAPQDGRLDVVLTGADGGMLISPSRRDLGQTGAPTIRIAAIDGEHLVAGEVYDVRLEITGFERGVRVGVGADGMLSLGWIAGADDGLDVIGVGAVTLLERQFAAAVRLHDAVLVEPDPEDAAAIVVGRRGLVGEPVVLDRAPRELAALGSVAAQEADLRILSSSIDDGRVEVWTRTDRPAVLVVAQTAYPGWRAEIDGVAAEIHTADATLLGVVVPEGEHTVILEFRPSYLRASVVVWLATAVFAAVLWFRPRRTGPAGGVDHG